MSGEAPGEPLRHGGGPGRRPAPLLAGRAGQRPQRELARAAAARAGLQPARSASAALGDGADAAGGADVRRSPGHLPAAGGRLPRDAGLLGAADRSAAGAGAAVPALPSPEGDLADQLGGAADLGGVGGLPADLRVAVLGAAAPAAHSSA